MLALFTGTIGKIVIIGLIIAGLGGYIWFLRHENAGLTAQVSDITAAANAKISEAQNQVTAAQADAQASKDAFDKFKIDAASIDANLQQTNADAVQRATDAATTIEQVNNAPASKCLPDNTPRLVVACDGLRRQQLGYLAKPNAHGH